MKCVAWVLAGCGKTQVSYQGIALAMPEIVLFQSLLQGLLLQFRFFP